MYISVKCGYTLYGYIFVKFKLASLNTSIGHCKCSAVVFSKAGSRGWVNALAFSTWWTKLTCSKLAQLHQLEYLSQYIAILQLLKGISLQFQYGSKLIFFFSPVSGFVSAWSNSFQQFFPLSFLFLDINLVSQGKQHCSKLEVLLQKKLLILEGHHLNVI